MKGSTVRKALESETPLNSLYALIPENRLRLSTASCAASG